MDFTLTTYTKLLRHLKASGYTFQTFQDFLKAPASRVVVLRHDVDRLPGNALTMARLEHGLGIPASYYFRAVPESWDEAVITEIASLGHEIGYHYENLSTCNGDMEKAFADFKANLERLRKLAPVSTICMHGSPRSPWDSRELWKRYDYRKLGIIGEPYLDVDFNDVFYLTDTGRRWDGWKVSVRDKMPQQADWIRHGLLFHSTADIIRAAKAGKLPAQIMFTVHPQRWTNHPLPWLKEFIWQNTKNIVKRVVAQRT